MKTLLIIGCLIALVWLGVANSPKGESDVIFFEAELSATEPTTFYLGTDEDGKPKLTDKEGQAILLVDGAKVSDFKTPEEIEYRQQSAWYDSLYQHHPYRSLNDDLEKCEEQDRKFDGLCIDPSGAQTEPRP